MHLEAIYIKLSQASVLVPVILGVRNYQHLDRAFKFLVWFYVASVLFEVQASILKYIYHNNMPGLHLFTFVEFGVYSLVFFSQFHPKKLWYYLFVANSLGFVVIAFLDAFIINNIWQPNTMARSHAGISLVLYSLIYFYLLFKNDLKHYSWQYPMFWVCIGSVVYFGANLFYFMLIRYLVTNAQNTGLLSLYTHATINIISNVLFAQSFKCFKKLTTK